MVVNRVKDNHNVVKEEYAWGGRKHQGTLGHMCGVPIRLKFHAGLQEAVTSKLSQKTEYAYIVYVETKV